MGRVFMPSFDDPFRAADRILESLPAEMRIRIVDIHAEATSEKVAMVGIWTDVFRGAWHAHARANRR